MQNIVILISGTGSNMQALVRAEREHNWRSRLHAQVVAVVSNQASAKGLQWAQDEGLATAVVAHQADQDRSDFDKELQAKIDEYSPSLVLLAGFMRILTSEFVAHYAGRLLNIHPSFLPAFQGLHTHQRALDAGCQFAGASVHEVSAEVDAGRILAQVAVPILPNDTAQTLGQRVLAQEHGLYPLVVEQWLERNDWRTMVGGEWLESVMCPRRVSLLSDC